MAYIDIAEIRSIDQLDDTDFFPDALVESAIAQAEETIDAYTGTSFEYKDFEVRLNAKGKSVLLIPFMFPRTITLAEADGVAMDTTNWWLNNDGTIESPYPFRGIITLEGTAGMTADPPEEIKWATRVLSANTLIQRESRIPDRATAIQSEFGQVLIAQAGGRFDRPTEFPGVNAILNRWRQRPPGAW